MTPNFQSKPSAETADVSVLKKPPMCLISLVNTCVFILSFLFIGIPLWWKTTTVYRHSIPYDECEGLLSDVITHTIPVKLVLEDRKVLQGTLWEKLIKQPVFKTKGAPGISFQWTMTSISEEEEYSIKKQLNFTVHDMASKQEQFNSENSVEDYGHLTIFVLNPNFRKTQEKFVIGNQRMGFIINSEDSNTLVEDIVFLSKKLVQADRLQKLYTPPSSYDRDKIPDKEKMRHLRSTQEFDVIFSLIVPEPQNLDIHWDIVAAIDAYLKEILHDIQLISSVKVKSQVLYMTSLPIPTVDSEGKHIVYSHHLPSLINPIETKLGSDTSVHPNLNFVLYIPTKEQTPLQIQDNEGEAVRSNAFLSPQWGGFMIYNCPLPENASLPHSVELDPRRYMGVFLTQFRLLLGLPDKSYLSDQAISLLSGPVIRKWEIDFLLRKNAQEQISSSISSLSSLSQLLKTIKNIVIEDEVGQKIHFALASVKESLSLLKNGHLKEGFLKAQLAFIASDEAFFDPSLLALLYFPEDQKYAIYIPLFLPVSIPVLTSIGYLWKYYKDTKIKHLKD